MSMETATPTAPTVTPTSAPSTGTPEATPATSASSPSISPDQRPSFAQAFADDAAQESSEPVAQPEGATTAPATTPETPSAIHPSTEVKQGPVPFDVHQKSMDNARLKATQELQATFDRDYGWAKELPREKLVEWSGIASLMASDPPAFLEKYFAETVQHPTFGPHVKSWAAKTLATRVQGDTEPQPDREIVDQQGNVIGTAYADGGKAHSAWLKRQFDQAVDQRMQPFEQERKAKQDAADAAEKVRQFNATVDAKYAPIERLLKGQEHLGPEIAKAIKEQEDVDPMILAIDVLEKHKPDREAQRNAQVLEDLKTKAAANGMNPAGAVVATTHKPTSFLDKSLQW